MTCVPLALILSVIGLCLDQKKDAAIGGLVISALEAALIFAPQLITCL